MAARKMTKMTKRTVKTRIGINTRTAITMSGVATAGISFRQKALQPQCNRPRPWSTDRSRSSRRRSRSIQRRRVPRSISRTVLGSSSRALRVTTARLRAKMARTIARSRQPPHQPELQSPSLLRTMSKVNRHRSRRRAHLLLLPRGRLARSFSTCARCPIMRVERAAVGLATARTTKITQTIQNSDFKVEERID